jgi:hypothetical protein
MDTEFGGEISWKFATSKPDNRTKTDLKEEGYEDVS